jgi:hypothetical protein
MRPSYSAKPSIRKEGAGNAGRTNAPAASRASERKYASFSHHGHTGTGPAFPARWFYGFLRALPGERFRRPGFLTPSLAAISASLTPASGRLLPAFRSSCATCGLTFTNFGKQRAVATFLIPVPPSILKFLSGFAAYSIGTSRSAALVPHGFVACGTAFRPARHAPDAACIHRIPRSTFVTVAIRPSSRRARCAARSFASPK